MENNTNTTISHLKCNNCGSSHFTQNDEDLYVCNYCGSTIKLKNTINDKFVSFFKPTAKAQNNIHVVKPILSKNQFAKNAIIYLGMSPDVPENVLDASFEKVKQSYGYYVAFDVEFTIITISSEIRGTILQKEEGSTSNHKQTSCCRVVAGDQIYSDIVLNKVHTAKEIVTQKISREEVLSLDKNFPSKEAVKQAIEDEVLRLKQKLQQSLRNSSVKIVHNIVKSDLYIVPEYMLKYNYDGKPYFVQAIGCEDKLYGVPPKSTGSSLDKRLSQKAKKVFAVPTIISACAVVFMLMQLFFFRYISFITYDVIAVLLSIGSFVIADKIQKPITIKYKTQYFEQRKQKVDEYIKNNKLPQVDSTDEVNIGKYMRWY